MTTVVKLLLVQIAYVTVNCEYELILHEGLSTDNYFPSLAGAYSTNEDDPTAELYSIIGQWNDNTDKQNQYKDDSGKYQFKLVYSWDDNAHSQIEIEFKQSSWINAVAITGYELISSSGLPSSYSPTFVGLLRSSRSDGYCYLNGQADACYWTIAAGPDWSGNGHHVYSTNSDNFADQVSLFINKLVSSCEGVTCPFGSVCNEDTGECAIHCSTMNIDEYIGECSANVVVESDLSAQIDAVHDRIDGITSTLNVPDRESIIPFINNDTVIMGLVLSNMLLLCYICYVHSKMEGNSPYKTVKVYSSEDEDKPINQL